jgi:hypothetical protein
MPLWILKFEGKIKLIQKIDTEYKDTATMILSKNRNSKPEKIPKNVKPKHEAQFACQNLIKFQISYQGNISNNYNSQISKS